MQATLHVSCLFGFAYGTLTGKAMLTLYLNPICTWCYPGTYKQLLEEQCGSLKSQTQFLQIIYCLDLESFTGNDHWNQSCFCLYINVGLRQLRQIHIVVLFLL